MRPSFRGLVPAAFSALAILPGIASAADLGGGRQRWDAPPAYYPAAFRWSGFYAGLQAGYGWSDTDASSLALGSGLAEYFSYTSTGAVGGVHLGFNWQVDRVVAGIETDLELSGIGNSGGGRFGGVHFTDLDWLGSTRARLGYTFGNSLLYVTGGLAYGGVSVERSAGAGLLPFASESQWKTGWTLGGGLEHAFTQSISARLEYRYTDLGDVTYTRAGISDTTNISQSAVRAGVSIKF